MKQIIKSYFSFTRAERTGFVALGGLLLLLVVFRVTMVYWVHPSRDAVREEQLNSAWAAFKARNETVADSSEDLLDNKGRSKKDMADIGVIDLNEADSATLVQLKGIGPASAGKIIAWRNKHGRFTAIKQLNSICRFSDKTYDTLKNHLVIGSR